MKYFISGFGLGLICLPVLGQPINEKPNIVFILADDMGYGDLSCYGNQFIKTPNIDRLAAEGTNFINCYAGSAISSPSRCALMTGKHTGHTTIRDNFCKAEGLPGYKGETLIRRMHLLETDTTLANVLGNAGYRTCLVNKWHLDGFNPGAGPLDRGFDEFYGWLISTAHSNDPYYYPYFRFDNRDLTTLEDNEKDQRIKHNTDISTEDAIRFIQNNKGNPFFLYLAYDAPHEPYIINETFWYDDQEDWDGDTKRYASLITHMDAAIGRVVNELEKLGLRENTIIIFSSDNGAAVQAPIELLNCNGSFRGRKGNLYEGGIRVPLIVNCPGRIKKQTLQNIVYFPDMMPTLAALGNASVPVDIDGIDFSPLFSGKEVNTDERLLYWEFPGKQIAARQGKWKIIQPSPKENYELYNLQEDPFEKNNLAEKYPDILNQLINEAVQARTPSPNWPLVTD
ncbi:MAG: sulfatase-like hydrolase/transferase [Odoribacter sp.]|nr:sulfatase-like hydrolase/transferase [Odoribacter sp.]